MYLNATSKVTGEKGKMAGRPGADAKPFGKDNSPGMYIRLTPPLRMVRSPSASPGITGHVSSGNDTQSNTRISFGLPFSNELSKMRPLESMAT